MGEKIKVVITHQQAQALFVAAVSFAMPEKVGDDPVPLAERRDAEEEVLRLYQELKPLSPKYLKSKKFTLFGPADNWEKEQITIEGKTVESNKLKDPDLEIKLMLDEDAVLGAERILYLRLHAGSPNKSAIWEREDVLWPTAVRLRLTQKLRRLLKLDDRQKRRVEFDEMLSNEKKDNGKPPADPGPTKAPAAGAEQVGAV